MNNAVKFRSNMKFIAISLREHDEVIYSSIRDNDTGMTEEIRRHAFDKFEQYDKSRSHSDSGLD